MSGHSFTFEASHLVWSTAHRLPLIRPEWTPRLYEYAGGICRKVKCDLLAAGGMPDHVHFLVRYHPSVSTADLLRVLKSKTSGWIKTEVARRTPFAWQRGYGAFSVSENRIAGAKAYIRNQARHHRAVTYQEEFIAFLEKHKMPYDPRYVWQ